MKEYLAKAPLLSIPRDGNTLYLYLVVSKWATNSVRIREEVGIQCPIYYTNNALLNAETRYQWLGVELSVYGSIFLVFGSLYNPFGFENSTQMGRKIILLRCGSVLNSVRFSLIRVCNSVRLQVVNFRLQNDLGY